MKCLSIRQPWAWLIVKRYKPVENRGWPTNLRGEVLIHAAKGCTAVEFFDALDWIKDHPLAHEKKMYQHASNIPALSKIDRGAIIGKATLVDCVEDHHSPYFVGPYGHVFAAAQRCEPFPYKGTLGYFEVPDEVVSQLKWIEQ